jgi:sensor c-di-GMP phosphodiesterase-like protein
MKARRRRVITLAVLLGALGVIIPIAAMTWISWQVANEKELSVLEMVASRVITRADVTFADARSAIKAMQKPNLLPCSNEHITRMRTETINVPAVEEIGYFENGFLKCTSWGLAPAGIAKTQGDFTTPDGMEVFLRIRPIISRGKPMTALQLGSYNALVVPSRFVDVIVDKTMAISLMNNNGLVINTLNDPDVELATRLAGQEQSGLSAAHFYTAVRRNGLVVVVMEPRSLQVAQFTNQMTKFLPIGVFIALFTVGIVYWMSKKRLSPKAELEIAVRHREFIVHYQPIIQLESGICFGAEALVRWRRPDGTLVRPDLFIPLAEESGLIVPITDQVVETVITELNSLLVRDRTLHIAINLCAEDIVTGRILDFLDKRLEHTGIHKAQIWLEATERGFINIDAARAMVDRARKSGHAVAIDDFGTGYSSLQYLQGLPMDALKIDKSFVDTIGKNTATSSVILHIIEMAQELALFSVAEGVETEVQAAYLRAHGVNFAQGWHFSKPLPAKEFIEFHTLNKQKFGSAPEVVRFIQP